MAEFYNKGDQEIFKNFKFVPQEKYRTGFTAPGGQDASTPSFGITNTNAFTNSGGGETRYDNSFLPDLPQFNYVDMVRKYGADSKQAQQMLTKSGATYPGDFQSNEGGFEYTNSFPDNSIQMENLDNSYFNKGNTFQGERFNTNIQDEKQMIAEMAAEGIAPGDPYTYNNNRFSTIEGQNNIFDVNVKGDPALNRGSKMAQGDDPYSEKAFEEEEDKKGFLSKMISRAKQLGSNLPGWAKVAATAMGGPFAAAASFLGNTGNKGYEQFDPRGNIKGGVYTMDGVNYANPSIVNESYDNDPLSPTYGTNRFDRAKPGSFASYRTLKDFFDSKKDNKNTTTNNNNNNNNNDGGGGENNSGDTESQTNSQAGVGGFADYAKGGRVGYFFGGRARLQGGGMSQGNESNISQSTNMGGGITGDLSTPEQTANHNRAMRDNQREKPSTIKNIIDTGSELSYLNNLKNLNVPGIALNFGVNKFRNFLDNRKTKEEDKLSYNTNSLPTNNYFAEVKQKDLDASKMKGFKQQDYPSYKDQMEMLGGTTVSPYEFKGLQDGTITTTGTFTAANGGRAMFKNGGLASIL